MPSNEDTFEGEGFVLRTFEDRIEVDRKKRRQSIAYSEIESVSVARRPRRLVVVTHAGKRHEFVMRYDVEAARVTVASHIGDR